LKKAMRFLTKIFFVFLVISLSFASDYKKIRFATVIFPSGKVFQLEIASTEQEWIKGLMFRKFLARNSGMLFVYPKEDFFAIWMKNCFIPLDILWLDSKGRIIYIIENAPPCKEEPCPVYQPIGKARYVIELNAGTVKSLGLKLGDRVDIILPAK